MNDTHKGTSSACQYRVDDARTGKRLRKCRRKTYVTFSQRWALVSVPVCFTHYDALEALFRHDGGAPAPMPSV